MTGTTPLTADELATLRRELAASADDLRARLAGTDVPDLSWCGDAADQADNVVEIDLADIVEERDRAVLLRLEKALARLDRGDYGWCTTCRGAIPTERLRAFPQAVTCVGCG